MSEASFVNVTGFFRGGYRGTDQGIRGMEMLEEQKMKEAVQRFGSAAGESGEFLRELTAGLLASPEIGEEFLFYAEMDRERTGMGNNGSKMILRAFDTMLKMEKEPEKYKQLMQSETGTDYPEKY